MSKGGMLYFECSTDIFNHYCNEYGDFFGVFMCTHVGALLYVCVCTSAF